jgi:hypothetical protein
MAFFKGQREVIASDYGRCMKRSLSLSIGHLEVIYDPKQYGNVILQIELPR